MTMPHRISLRRPGVLMALVAVALVFLAQGDAAEATFNPVATFELVDTSPGANSDIKATFDLPLGDVNFSGLVNFIPKEVIVGLDADIPDGAVLAKLSSQATLGLIGAHCGNGIGVNFTMFEGTTNTANIITPLPIGKADQLRPLMEDGDGNGIIDAADKYPSYLLALFDPDWVDAGPDDTPGTADDNNGPEPPLKPIARQVGATEPTGTGLAVILNFLLFEPGTHLPDIEPFPTSFGYPSVTVLQDPTVPASPGLISDFCSPLKTATTNYGLTVDNPNTAANEGGISYRKNPDQDGFYRFIILARGLPDADGDGFENSLDTCAELATPTWDPRVPGGGGLDPDQDGLPSGPGCDPNPATSSLPGKQPPDCEKGNTGADEDQDCYSNRQDNCPLEANFDQKDDDDDSIGNLCDSTPAVLSGTRPLVCTVLTVKIGSPAGSEPPFDCEAVLAAGDPATTADADNDGVADAADRCPNTPAGATVDATGCTAQQAVLDDDNDGVKNADDACPSTAAGASVNAAGCSAAQLASGTGDDGTGGPSTGVGSLAPVASSIPAWAAIASGLGGAGFLGAIGSFVRRTFRRRRRD